MFQFLLKMIKRQKEGPSKKRPIIIAHRGARKLAPENTISAFRKAIKIGFDGVELDVVLSKDKVPVVFHGNDLSHSTRATGFIHETPVHELQKIDAGSLFDPSFEGEKIPTLAEALNLLSSCDIFTNIELKSQPRGHKGLERIVGEMINSYGMTKNVLVSSFSPLILRRFHKIFPDIPTALLVGPHPFFFLKTLLFANMVKYSAINPIFQYTSKALLDFALAKNWQVFVWAVNTRQEFMRAIELGVDGIITDEPDLLKVNT